MNHFLHPQGIADNAMDASGILYFLAGGHYLFRWWSRDKWESKFVTVDDVAAALSNVQNDSGWLGEGILRAGRSARGQWFVYSAPAQHITLTLTTGGPGAVTVPIPATVLIGVDHAYYLFAVSEAAARPTSMIYHAPFPNVYSHGRICWGANKPPKAHHKHARAVWQMFFETPFNSHLANKKSSTFESDVTGQLRALAISKAEKYPLDDLQRAAGSLDSLVQQVLDRNWRE